MLSVLAKAFSYPLLALFPVFVAMVGVGFNFRDECPADKNVPLFLFFGGLSGVFAVLLRILLIIKWRSIRSKYSADFQPQDHPAFGMVRCIMYLFLFCTAFLNFHTTSLMIGIHGTDSCSETLHNFSFIVVIIFNLIFGVSFFAWLSSMLAGICYPDIMIKYFYEEDIIPPDVQDYLPAWLKVPMEFKQHSRENGNSMSITDDEKNNMAKNHHKASVEKEKIPMKELKITMDTPDGPYDPLDDDCGATLSVRFAAEVNQRRISRDDGTVGSEESRFNITNFPEGPSASDQNAKKASVGRFKVQTQGGAVKDETPAKPEIKVGKFSVSSIRLQDQDQEEEDEDPQVTFEMDYESDDSNYDTIKANHEPIQSIQTTGRFV